MQLYKGILKCQEAQTFPIAGCDNIKASRLTSKIALKRRSFQDSAVTVQA